MITNLINININVDMVVMSLLFKTLLEFHSGLILQLLFHFIFHFVFHCLFHFNLLSHFQHFCKLKIIVILLVWYNRRIRCSCSLVGGSSCSQDFVLGSAVSSIQAVSISCLKDAGRNDDKEDMIEEEHGDVVSNERGVPM